MSEELAVRRMDNEQVQLVKNTIAKGASDIELALFVEQCNRTQLDPFSRQIYLVGRFDGKLQRQVFQTQISIDGARLVAQRSSEYAGQTPVYYCGRDRQWTDLWLEEDGYPVAAKVGVYRRGFVEPLWATATWTQYVQTVKGGEPNSMWRKMPALMLGKCAESLALRKAFPMELSGLYTAEEMGQMENPEPAIVTKSSSKPKPQGALRGPPSQVMDEILPATPETVAHLKAQIDALVGLDLAKFKAQWKDAGIPALSKGLSQHQAERATALADAILNATDEIVDAEVVDAADDEWTDAARG